MALTFPLQIPTTIGIESIELTAMNAVALSQSPFTFSQQVVSYPGERWAVNVSIPPLRRDVMAAWKAFLVSLRGQTGTFLMGDPDYQDGPRGGATACTVTGTAGSSSPTVALTGTLLAGDYIQIGIGSSARLHMVLADQTGNGTLEIWPSLRQNYTSANTVLDTPKGHFRLAGPSSSWSINNQNAYGLSFTAVEVL